MESSGWRKALRRIGSFDHTALPLNSDVSRHAMSLDYPFYEELRRRGHRAAIWWRVGDLLYYVGLLIALPLVVVSVALVGASLMFTLSWEYLGWSLAGLASGVVVFLLGSSMKGHSYALAMKDGIDVNDY